MIRLLIIVLLTIMPVPALAQACLEPEEPFLFQIDKTHDREFNDFTRDEFQAYFEKMEIYLRCLEHERGAGVERLKEVWQIFRENFKDDAAFRIKQSDPS